MRYVAAVDLGTTYLKAMIVDENGVPQRVVRKPVRYDPAGPRRVELAAGEFLSSVSTAVCEAREAAGIASSQIDAFSYSSQANTFTLLDKGGESLIPFISWQDTRVDEPPPSLSELWSSPDFLRTTGIGFETANLSVAKYRMIVAESPDIRRRARHFMNVSDYLVYSLTGEFRGDGGTAALLGLLDVQTLDWWDEGLRAAGLSRDMMSEPIRPGVQAGVVQKPAAELFGLPEGIPVVAGSLDHHAAGIGAGVPVLAPVSESTGTVIACLAVGNDYHPLPGCSVGPASHPDAYYYLSFDSEGGTLLERYRAEKTPELSFAELDTIVERTDLVGDQRRIAGEVRGIMEGTAAKLKRLVTALRSGDLPPSIVATGGGAKSRPWLRIKAAAMNTTMVVPEADEPACRGAAVFAAAACGWFGADGVPPSSWHRVRMSVSPNGSVREPQKERDQ